MTVSQVYQVTLTADEVSAEVTAQLRSNVATKLAWSRVPSGEVTSVEATASTSAVVTSLLERRGYRVLSVASSERKYGEVTALVVREDCPACTHEMAAVADGMPEGA